jgi:hypothetical protein
VTARAAPRRKSRSLTAVRSAGQVAAALSRPR